MDELKGKPPLRRSLSELRATYQRGELSEQKVHRDPVEQFKLWFDDSVAAELIEPNAMTLATATRDGRPSARMVLLKGIEAGEFVFYTNYESRKGQELASNPSAALLFFWAELERQVRIEGRVQKVDRAWSESYFATRPRESRLGAWASKQSQVVGSRAELDRQLEEMAARYEGSEAIPAPEHWGGFRLKPSLFEFWQGRRGRLHDRLQYIRIDDGSWRIDRLSP